MALFGPGVADMARAKAPADISQDAGSGPNQIDK